MKPQFGWFAAGLAVMAVVAFVFTGQLDTVLPFLLLLACPLMMMLMMRGMGSMDGGGHNDQHSDQRSDGHVDDAGPDETSAGRRARSR